MPVFLFIRDSNCAVMDGRKTSNATSPSVAFSYSISGSLLCATNFRVQCDKRVSFSPSYFACFSAAQFRKGAIRYVNCFCNLSLSQPRLLQLCNYFLPIHSIIPVDNSCSSSRIIYFALSKCKYVNILTWKMSLLLLEGFWRPCRKRVGLAPILCAKHGLKARQQ